MSCGLFYDANFSSILKSFFRISKQFRRTFPITFVGGQVEIFARRACETGLSRPSTVAPEATNFGNFEVLREGVNFELIWQLRQ